MTTSRVKIEDVYVEVEPNHPRDAGPAALVSRRMVLDVLKRRWWLLALLLALSGGVAYVVCTVYASRVATSTATIKYAPLPSPPGPHVYSPPSIHECARLATSARVMSRLIETHQLEATPTDLAACFDVHVPRDNGVMEVSFAWPDKTQAIAVLNSFAEIYIEEAQRTRAETLTVRKQHVAELLDSATRRVDDVRSKLHAYERQAAESAQENGTGGEQVAGMLERVRAAETALDSAAIRRASLEARLQQASELVASLTSEARNMHRRLRKEQLTERMQQFTPGSAQFQRLAELSVRIEQFDRQESVRQDYLRWTADFESLTADALGELEETDAESLEALEARLAQAQTQLERADADRLPLDAEIAALTKRLDLARDRARTVVSDATGVSPATLRALEEEYEQVESERRGVRMQMNSLEQLENYITPELSVFSPASNDTTKVDSNRKKLFLMTLAACLGLLVAPVFGIELFLRSNHPMERVLRSWRLPVLGRGVVDSYIEEEEPEAAIDLTRHRGLNLLALRLQRALAVDSVQAASDQRQLMDVFEHVLRLPHEVSTETADRALQLLVNQADPKPSPNGSGKVVMFSGLDHEMTPAPLVRALAELLSKRGERVLVIDAVRDSSAASRDDTAAADEQPVAETFHTARQTDGALIDILMAGESALAPEATAVCGLARILDQCRDVYTMILVAGPSTNHPADVELLAPLADGTVFTVNQCSLRGRYGREVIDELLACGTRILGFVG